MLRLRLILCAATIAIVVSVSIFLGCGADRPTHPGESSLAPRVLFGGGMSVRADSNAYLIYVQTSAELDTALDESIGLTLVDGDTILLKTGVEFDLGSKTGYTIFNKTLFIMGEEGVTRPSVKSRPTSGSWLLRVVDGADPDKHFLWRNIDLDLETTNIHALKVIDVAGFENSIIEDCDADLGSSYVKVTAEVDTLRSSTFSSKGRSLMLVPEADDTHIFVGDVSVDLQSSPLDNYAVNIPASTQTCAVTLSNMSFTGPSDKYSVQVSAGNQTGEDDPVITLGLLDCDFGSQAVFLTGAIGESDEVFYSVTWDGNDNDVGGCYDDAVTDNGEVQVAFTSVVSPWYAEGNVISWASVGEVDESSDTYSVVKCDDTYYLIVAFALEDDEDAAYGDYFNPPVVKYNEADSTMSHYATVYWNSGISKWNAEMDLTNLSSPIDWQCTMAVCDSTATGSRVEDISYTLKGAGPCTIQEFMGGGDEEEEEEEAEQ